MNTYFKILFFLSLLFVSNSFLVSCSNFELKSHDDFPIYFNTITDHKRTFNHEQTLDFYLFGFLPENYSLYIDELAREDGFKEVSNVSITTKITFQDALISFFTLGFYTPKTVEIKGLGK